MCFRSKDGSRLIHSRSYKYSSGTRFLGIGLDKSNDRELIIELTNNGGFISLELTNLSTIEKETLNNPKTGEYIFKIRKNIKYRFIIRTKSAIGGYKIKIHNI